MPRQTSGLHAGHWARISPATRRQTRRSRAPLFTAITIIIVVVALRSLSSSSTFSPPRHCPAPIVVVIPPFTNGGVVVIPPFTNRALLPPSSSSRLLPIAASSSSRLAPIVRRSLRDHHHPAVHQSHPVPFAVVVTATPFVIIINHAHDRRHPTVHQPHFALFLITPPSFIFLFHCHRHHRPAVTEYAFPSAICVVTASHRQDRARSPFPPHSSATVVARPLPIARRLH